MAVNSPDVEFDLKDIEKAVEMLNKVGKSPQRAVSRAAAKAATIVKRAIRQGTVPVGRTGNLKRAIARKAEKTRKRGKKVYEITFDRKYNEVLQKPIKNPGEAGGKNPKAYYPASQEYGFLTRSKGGGIRYVPGLHFMRQGAENADAQARQVMMETLEKELDKLWQEATHA